MKTILALTALLVTCACAHAPTAAETAAAHDAGKAFALERASFDTKCDAAQMTASFLGSNPDRYGVRGCNQACTYVVSCSAGSACEVLKASCDKDQADDKGATK